MENVLKGETIKRSTPTLADTAPLPLSKTVGLLKDKKMQQIYSREIWNSFQLNDIDLFAAEENATFWLWAYPSLISWPRRFEWLFSPVVGNVKHPGDLWGIDEAGNLLLVETKRGKRTDPFKDFIGYEEGTEWISITSTKQITERWKTLYESERNFWQNHKDDLSKEKLKEIKARGVVPYSSKRYATRQWQTLYSDVIAHHLFEDQAYLENVNQFLSASSREQNRTIYYLGLIFVDDTSLATLSEKGQDHFVKLRSMAGDDRVTIIWITAKKLSKEQSVLLQCGRLTK